MTKRDAAAVSQSTDNKSQRPAVSASTRAELRFDDKVALITGASDRGIGGAIAERMAVEGAAVALASPHEPKKLLKRLARLENGSLWSNCDITQSDEVRRAIDACMDEFGKIDILVNNAGVEFAQPFDDCSESLWEDLLEVNLSGAIRVSQAALPHLAAPGGVIVNIASALALGGCPGFTFYSASKAGLVGLTQSLAWELAPRRIRVVCVAPGLVETPMTFKHVHHRNPTTQAQLDACHPLGVGSPHDVASAVAFLASDDACWITGITLPLGWTQHYPLPVAQFMAGVNPEPAKPDRNASGS